MPHGQAERRMIHELGPYLVELHLKPLEKLIGEVSLENQALEKGHLLSVCQGDIGYISLAVGPMEQPRPVAALPEMAKLSAKVNGIKRYTIFRDRIAECPAVILTGEKESFMHKEKRPTIIAEWATMCVADLLTGHLCAFVAYLPIITTAQILERIRVVTP